MSLAIDIGLGVTSLTPSTGGGGLTSLYGMLVGQSYIGGMQDKETPVPAAAADTQFFDGADYIAVPEANGIRQLANTLKSLFNVPITLAASNMSGVRMSYFVDGGDGWTDLTGQLDITGAPDFVVLWIGAGDADGNGTRISFKNSFRTFYTDLLAYTGKTAAQLPIFFISLPTFAGLQSQISDYEWWDIQAGIRELCNENEHVHFIGSTVDLTLIDKFHPDEPEYEKAADRMAYKVAKVFEFTETDPLFEIASVSLVDATHIDVTLTHGLGDDFTPTSAITGFRTSADNMGTWDTPSAAVRQDANTIRLTIPNDGSVVDHYVDYQYGAAPTLTGQVFDDGTLTMPLALSAGQILRADGSGSLPMPYFVRGYQTTDTNITQTFTGINLAHLDEESLVVFGVGVKSNRTITAMTITPEGGDAIATSAVATGGSSSSAHIRQAVIDPSGLSGLENCTVVVTLSSNAFSASVLTVATVPTSRLDSTTAVDSDSTTASSTTATLSLSSTAGGFIFGLVSVKADVDCTWSGDETYVKRYDDAYMAGFRTTCADAFNVGAGTNDNDITATFDASQTFTMVAVSYY
jgi:hypothetical protein